MSEEIKKLIDDSIAAVIDTEEVVSEVEKLEIMKGYYGNKLYDKLNPEKEDLAFKTVGKLSKKLAEERSAAEGMGVKEHLAKAGQKAVKGAKEAAEDLKGKAANMDVKDHLVAAGKKAVSAVKDKAEELKDTVREHPALAAATAAGLAAGVGGLAAVKKMRKAAKKK
jgi:ElaB/YqjD/DUF883 family membrane-anchored ribosome-binding protein